MKRRGLRTGRAAHAPHAEMLSDIDEAQVRARRCPGFEPRGGGTG
ncbi:hypothetical protein BURPS406E_K0047 [Burkholderia pseudomallei 406e]|nr:hypothetical protein BMASAVP1_A0781 [Burkholderia mallei SAVP1]ABO06780.1 hypothetical protein BMA10247_1999 [Burkholderia mallei NCTC 10247]EDK53722.1 hypothetical protein BMAFMH_0362 [Burkholderia mallei FMH]EDK58690.1 hypothetical protein BMAJHU_0363 [Burkholderia mallei JHU]EDO86146.1 hypothetical protein BURPS406E_K0047 [Burkholderia pseudomallei 406e]EEP88867.1 conserved hypothetical protein [Burkholderia mallei GB8 horse 4]EES27033.1 hypothetical protein BURPS1106B_A2269 [Burkholder